MIAVLTEVSQHSARSITWVADVETESERLALFNEMYSEMMNLDTQSNLNSTDHNITFHAGNIITLRRLDVSYVLNVVDI